MFYLCFIEKYDTQVIQVERNARPSILLHTLPKGKHLRSVTDAFNHKDRLSSGTGGTDTEDLLYKPGTTIVVQIKEIDGNTALQKKFGKDRKPKYNPPPLFRLSDRAQKRQAYRHPQWSPAGHNLPDGTEDVSLSSIRTSSICLSPIPVASVP